MPTLKTPYIEKGSLMIWAPLSLLMIRIIRSDKGAQIIRLPFSIYGVFSVGIKKDGPVHIDRKQNGIAGFHL